MAPKGGASGSSSGGVSSAGKSVGGNTSAGQSGGIGLAGDVNAGGAGSCDCGDANCDCLLGGAGAGGATTSGGAGNAGGESSAAGAGGGSCDPACSGTKGSANCEPGEVLWGCGPVHPFSGSPKPCRGLLTPQPTYCCPADYLSQCL